MEQKMFMFREHVLKISYERASENQIKVIRKYPYLIKAYILDYVKSGLDQVFTS